MQTTTGFARSSSTRPGNSSSRPRTTRPSGHGISRRDGVSRCSKRTDTLSQRWHGVEPRPLQRWRRTEREALRTARVRQKRRRWSMLSRVARSTRLSRCVVGTENVSARVRTWTDPRTCVRADLAPLICRNLTRAPASARSFAIRATFVFPTLADSQSGELRARACLAFHNWSWRFMCIFRFAVFVVLRS